MITVSIQVFGKVQGVWFRASTKKEADKLGLKGTVNNVDDGSVLIKVSGDQESINKLKKWCKKGPQFASVTEVKSQIIEKKEYDDFKIIRK